MAGDWSYTGETGPEYWYKEYPICREGKNQSPINLTGMFKAELPPLDLEYNEGGANVINNGHTIQVNYYPGSFLSIDEKKFALRQFHFHAPSENLIEGVSYALEGHFVHENDNGDIAVLAVMYDVGDANADLATLWSVMPENKGGVYEFQQYINASSLLPSNHEYYRFNGSLTTPPCSEGVLWLVMKDIHHVSQEQVDKFTAVMGGPNNRPVQPLNSRVVLG
jgi:carbonic anhydrase